MPEPRDDEPRRHHRRLENLKLFLGIPAAFMAMLYASGVVFKACGVTPPAFVGSRLNDHVTWSTQTHKIMDSAFKEQKELQEAQLIGECVENSCQQLALQKLLPFCFKNQIYRCRRWRDST